MIEAPIYSKACTALPCVRTKLKVFFHFYFYHSIKYMIRWQGGS